MIGSGIAIEDTDRDFIALDEILDKDQVVVQQRFSKARFELGSVANNADTDRRTLSGRLDHQREMPTALEQRLAVIPGTERDETRRRDLVVQKDLLGHNLVYGHARGHHAAAGVGDLQHLKEPLDRTILTIATVQTDESHLGSSGP